MLFRFYLKSWVYSWTVTLKGIVYRKSKELKRIESILHWIRFALTLPLLFGAYFLVKEKVFDSGYYGPTFIVFQVVIGQVIIFPFHLLFLPRPIMDHLVIQKEDQKKILIAEGESKL